MRQLFYLFFSLCFVTQITSAQCSDIVASERSQLLFLFGDLNGSAWTNNTNWASSNPVSTWNGITLTSDGCHVKRIFLQNNNVTGTLYNDYNLPYLEELVIIDNPNLTCSIPTFLYLPALKILALYRNGLTGGVPNISSSLFPNITHYQLEDNALTGAIPNLNLPTLQYLYLGNNLLTGTLPNFTLPALRDLFVGNPYTGNFNNLSGSLPSLVGCLNLQRIDFSHNSFTGSIPTAWNNLSQLNHLDISYNQLSGTLPNFIAISPNIAPVYINNNQFTFAGLEQNVPNFDNLYFPLIYSPQALIPTYTNIANTKLIVIANGTLANNTYRWYRKNSNLTGSTGGTLVATKTGNNKYTPTQSGYYYCKVKNSIATQLTLVSELYYFTLPNSSTKNELETTTTDNNTTAMQVLPTIAQQQVQISYNSSETCTATIKLHNINGQSVQQNQWQIQTGSNSQYFPIDLPNGYYLLTLTTPTTQHTQKILVVR